MANTYHQVYLQIVFAVKYRNAVIDEKWRSKLLSVIGHLINEAECKTIIVNGVEDHVHCLLALKPTITISVLMKAVKAKSSKFINENQLTKSKFHGRKVMVYFHIANRKLNLFINTFRIKKSIIKNKALMLNI